MSRRFRIKTERTKIDPNPKSIKDPMEIEMEKMLKRAAEGCGYIVLRLSKYNN
jgi:hypothetical protein